MYRSGFQDRQVRELMTENTELKKFYEQMKKELRSILSRHDLAYSHGLTDSLGVSRRAGLMGRARSTRAGDLSLTGGLKKQWNSLKQLLESLEVQVTQTNVTHVISVTDHEKELTSLRKELEELRQELERSREVISQQQELLQEQLLPKPGEGQASPLWDSYFLEEQLRLQQDRGLFEEQKRAFRDEREKFTEAAIRLGRERLQFKADQALFVKQQFLNMTPGLETPSWKKTPPWSSAAPGTPRARSSKNGTPNWSSASNSQHKKILNDPATPSTAELYRVLRLAPPSRSVLMSQRRECRCQTDSDAEIRRDSLSPRSQSPEPRTLPQSSRPLKVRMTPYLRPRQTPLLSASRRRDSTPGSAELYRILGVNSTGRHRRQELGYTGTPSVLCNEAFKKVETEFDGNHESARTSYDTDSLYSGETPASERGSYPYPRDGGDSVEKDSLYSESPMQVTTTVTAEECFRLGEGSLHCSGVPQLYMTDYGDNDHSWRCNEGCNVTSENYQSHPTVTFRPRESYMEEIHFRSREEVKGKEYLTPEGFSAQDSVSRRKHRSSSGSQEPQSLRCSCTRSQLTQKRNLENCSNCRSRETLHPRDSCKSHRRASCHEKDSLSFSGHRPASHFRRSCPSSRERSCCSAALTPSHLRADLLNKFLDCSM